MIVSKWQFLQKQVRCGSLGRVAKGVNHGKGPAQINFLSPFASTSFVCFEAGHCSCAFAGHAEPREGGCPFVVTEIPRFSVLPLPARLLKDRLNRRSASSRTSVRPFRRTR